MTMSSLIITRMAPQLPPKDKNNPNYKDRTLLETYKKNELTLPFRGTRTAPASRVEWKEYYLRLVPLIIEHPALRKQVLDHDNRGKGTVPNTSVICIVKCGPVLTTSFASMRASHSSPVSIGNGTGRSALGIA